MAASKPGAESEAAVAAMAVARVERDLYKYRPGTRDAHDAVAAAVHLALCALGWRPASQGFADGWNASDDVYTFKYRADVGPREHEVTVKGVRMDGLLVFHAAGDSLGGSLGTLETRVADAHSGGGDDVVGGFSDLDALVRRVGERLFEPVLAAALGRDPAAHSADARQRRAEEDAMERRRRREEQDARNPLRAGPPMRPGRGGDFGGDMFPPPFAGGPMGPMGPMGPPMPGGGGMYAGPGHPMFGRPGGWGPAGPRRPGDVGRPRYDPMGPFGDQGPDSDHLPPPGPPPPDMYM